MLQVTSSLRRYLIFHFFYKLEECYYVTGYYVSSYHLVLRYLYQLFLMIVYIYIYIILACFNNWNLDLTCGMFYVQWFLNIATCNIIL
jgi:hypothetical protein